MEGQAVMTGAPERIWRFEISYDERKRDLRLCTSDERVASETHCTPYIREDVAKPKVKPLVWIECIDATLHDTHCQYEIATDGGFWRVTKGVTGGGSYVCDCSTLQAAKAAAQADYERRILEALE